MEYHITTNTTSIDFREVRELMKQAGLTERPVELLKKAFTNSYICIFIYVEDKLVGVGRAISDEAYEAGIYDLVVLPQYQGKGLGGVIIKELLKYLDGMNIILYANPGVESFYNKLGFAKLLTGMIKFVNTNKMRSRGFIE